MSSPERPTEPSPGDVMFLISGQPGAGISARIKFRLIIAQMAKSLSRREGASFEVGMAEWDVAEERWAIPIPIAEKYDLVWRPALGEYIPRLMNESLDKLDKRLEELGK